MVIVIILSVLAGAVGGWLLCTLIGSQLSRKSFSAELSAEDKQAIADVKTSVTKVEAYVSTLLHLHIASTPPTAATTPTKVAG